MKKFEYKVISVPRAIPIGAKGYEKMVTEFETNLNKLGAEGWELVQRADDFADYFIVCLSSECTHSYKLIIEFLARCSSTSLNDNPQY